MEWQNVTDSALPKDAGIMEVQLSNGCISLACYVDHTWRVPLISGSKAEPKQSEIRNVVKWRAYAPVSQGSKKQKSTSPRTSWRTQISEPKPPEE